VATNDYHFITTWRIPATVEEVGRIIADADGLTRWWPSVYLAVREIEPGDARGLGKVIDLYTKGWLPYTLRWQFRITEINDRSFRLDAWGDFDGRGIWSFAQDGPDAVVTYDWQVRADKPLLRRFSFLLKPIFAANHEWAMRQGERSLRLELARRRATTAAERASIPPPPGPTSAAPLVAGLAAVGVGLVYLLRRKQ
jgi:hypothetical protein